MRRRFAPPPHGARVKAPVMIAVVLGAVTVVHYDHSDSACVGFYDEPVILQICTNKTVILSFCDVFLGFREV